MKVFTPKMEPARSSSTYRFIPSTMVITAIRKVMPMITPSREKKDLSLWAQICERASRTPSRKLTRAPLQPPFGEVSLPVLPSPFPSAVSPVRRTRLPGSSWRMAS